MMTMMTSSPATALMMPITKPGSPPPTTSFAPPLIESLAYFDRIDFVVGDDAVEDDRAKDGAESEEDGDNDDDVAGVEAVKVA